MKTYALVPLVAFLALELAIALFFIFSCIINLIREFKLKRMRIAPMELDVSLTP